MTDVFEYSEINILFLRWMTHDDFHTNWVRSFNAVITENCLSSFSSQKQITSHKIGVILTECIFKVSKLAEETIFQTAYPNVCVLKSQTAEEAKKIIWPDWVAETVNVNTSRPWPRYCVCTKALRILCVKRTNAKDESDNGAGHGPCLSNNDSNGLHPWP